MHVIVSGLGTKDSYYNKFVSLLNEPTLVYTLEPKGSRDLQIYEFVTYIHSLVTTTTNDYDDYDDYTIIAFSLGCPLVLQSLPYLVYMPMDVIFINPANIQYDITISKSQTPGKWMWSMPRTWFSWIYSWTISRWLEEPPSLIYDLLEHPYDYWKCIVDEIGILVDWDTLLKETHTHQKIFIITSVHDRYHSFAKLLLDTFPSRLDGICMQKGQHHIIYSHVKEVARYIRMYIGITPYLTSCLRNKHDCLRKRVTFKDGS